MQLTGVQKKGTMKEKRESAMEIIPIHERPLDALPLMREYFEEIRRLDPEVARCLSAQDLEGEMQDLCHKYEPPMGGMYLALVDGVPAGCAAFRPNENGYCELKRMYVRPAYRGQHLGSALTKRVLADAKKAGYRKIRLDTFPFMTDALNLYTRHGFSYTGRYNDNPAKTLVFLEREL